MTFYTVPTSYWNSREITLNFNLLSKFSYNDKSVCVVFCSVLKNNLTFVLRTLWKINSIYFRKAEHWAGLLKTQFQTCPSIWKQYMDLSNFHILTFKVKNPNVIVEILCYSLICKLVATRGSMKCHPNPLQHIYHDHELYVL